MKDISLESFKILQLNKARVPWLKFMSIIAVSILVFGFVKKMKDKGNVPSHFYSGVRETGTTAGLLEIIIRDAALVDVTEDTRGLGYTGQKKLAIDSNGYVYVAYRKKISNDYHGIYVAKLFSRYGEKYSLFQEPKLITSAKDKINHRVPSIVIDAKDNIHIVWYSDFGSNGRQIYYSKSVDGGANWTIPTGISGVPGYGGQNQWQEHPDLWVDAVGIIYVVWEGKDMKNNNQQIKISRSADGGAGWENWRNINVSSDSSQSRPTILGDDLGRLHLFMYSRLGGEHQQIWHSVSKDSGISWSSWNNISRMVGDSRHITADFFNGTIYAAWRTESVNSDGSDVHFSTFENDVWSTNLKLTGTGYNYFPSLTTLQGNVFVSWSYSEDGAKFPKEDPQEGVVQMKFITRDSENVSEVIDVADGLYPYIHSNLGSVVLIFESTDGDGYPIYLVEIVKK